MKVESDTISFLKMHVNFYFGKCDDLYFQQHLGLDKCVQICTILWQNYTLDGLKKKTKNVTILLYK